MTDIASHPADAARPQPDRLGPFATLLLVAGPMLTMIDSAVLNVAIPQIAHSLDSSLSQAQWAVSGYLLGLAVGQAVVAWLDRRFGTYRAYTASLLLFAAASLACAAAPGIAALIAFRVLQGMVAAPLVPLALSLLLRPGTSREEMPQGHRRELELR
jgi:MFS family permease